MTRKPFTITVVSLMFMLLYSLAAASPLSYFKIIEDRNIFRPLWNMRVDNKSELEKARLEEEKRQADLQRQQEMQALEVKKSELAQSLSLSGVVFNGKNTYALITDRRTGQGGDYVVGDTLAGAKITDINEANQTVELDYQDKFKITLRISGK